MVLCGEDAIMMNLGNDENDSVQSKNDISHQIVASGIKRKGLGLTSKVIFLMLLVGILPVCIHFILASQQTARRIADETTENGKLVISLLAGDVDEWVDKNVRALKAIAKMPGMDTMNADIQERVIKALQEEYPWMYLVFTTDQEGRNVARSDGRGLKDYSSRKYIKDVILGADYSWQNLIGKTSNKPTLVLAVPIEKNGNIVGIVASAMTREALSERITTFKLGKTGSSFLVDQTGKTVAHRTNSYIISQKDMSNHPLIKASSQGTISHFEFTDANGNKSIGFSQKTRLGWVLSIQQEKDEAFEALNRERNFALALLGVTVVVIGIIAYLASRAIVAPIKRLTEAANRISRGELEVDIQNASYDEIGELADAIMRMQDSIRLSISRLKRRKR
jgi:methyl-accepting chemotaxis protein